MKELESPVMDACGWAWASLSEVCRCGPTSHDMSPPAQSSLRPHAVMIYLPTYLPLILTAAVE